MNKSTLHFTKMHGLGNDFVVINTLNQPIDIPSLPIAKLANRHLGIGFDQLLLIEPSTEADFFCRIFNADGSEAKQCGNGLRCIARFIHEQGLDSRASFSIATLAGIYTLRIQDYDHISVAMGQPDIIDMFVELPLAPTLSVKSISFSVLSVGNPHAIVKVDSIHSSIPDELGPYLSSHSYFPQGANVGFMQVVNPHHILLRTFERGVGETHACGSNACAAIVVGMLKGWLKRSVSVEFRYGSLVIEWKGGLEPVHMTGPASSVFTGSFKL